MIQINNISKVKKHMKRTYTIAQSLKINLSSNVL